MNIFAVSDNQANYQHFPLPTTSFASLALSPTGNHVAVWDGPLEVGYLTTIFRLRLNTFVSVQTTRPYSHGRCFDNILTYSRTRFWYQESILAPKWHVSGRWWLG